VTAKATRLLAIALVAGLAGCSGSGSQSGFITSSTHAVAEPETFNPADPQARVSQVVWYTTRAEKCGFYLDQQKLRGQYLTWEGEIGTDPAGVQKLGEVYDRMRGLLSTKVSSLPSAEYCNRSAVEETQRVINRYLAGDFTAVPPKKKPTPPPSTNWWGGSAPNTEGEVAKARKAQG
jgi:hypothetical protein